MPANRRMGQLVGATVSDTMVFQKLLEGLGGPDGAGSFAVTSSTYSHRFSEHRYIVKLVSSALL